MFDDEEDVDDGGSWATYRERRDDLRNNQRRQDRDYLENQVLQERRNRVCPDCGGSGLSPYAGDGGSCPHCILGYVD
jgi:hypothetical protein